MGTRHLIAVVQDGTYKVAQYGQFDGYPDGCGVELLRFLQKEDLGLFAKKVKDVSFITDEELSKRWVACGADENATFTTFDVAERFAKLHPENSRELSADLLPLILKSEHPLLLRNSLDFAKDSLFCEWGYVIDLDQQTFEVYGGFNEIPLNEQERFYFLQEKDSEYYPIRHVATFSLHDLPSEEDFVAQLEKEEV